MSTPDSSPDLRITYTEADLAALKARWRSEWEADASQEAEVSENLRAALEWRLNRLIEEYGDSVLGRTTVADLVEWLTAEREDWPKNAALSGRTEAVPDLGQRPDLDLSDDTDLALGRTEEGPEDPCCYSIHEAEAVCLRTGRTFWAKSGRTEEGSGLDRLARILEVEFGEELGWGRWDEQVPAGWRWLGAAGHIAARLASPTDRKPDLGVARVVTPAVAVSDQSDGASADVGSPSLQPLGARLGEMVGVAGGETTGPGHATPAGAGEGSPASVPDRVAALGAALRFHETSVTDASSSPTDRKPEEPK